MLYSNTSLPSDLAVDGRQLSWADGATVSSTMCVPVTKPGLLEAEKPSLHSPQKNGMLELVPAFLLGAGAGALLAAWATSTLLKRATSP